MTSLDAEIAVVGSGAGGATTAAVLAEAGRSVVVLEEGGWLDHGAFEPFSLGEMAAAYRHHGSAAALGAPPIAYAEGRCVGGSTEVNSGLWHRLPAVLADEWRRRYQIDEFDVAALDGWAERVEGWLGVSPFPGEAPLSSRLLAEAAGRLGWRSVEFPRVYRYDERGRGTKQTMSRTLLPRATAAGATIVTSCRVRRLLTERGRVVGLDGVRHHAGGREEPIMVRADQVVVCGGAIQTPALLQRSGFRRNVGRGLKLHPTIKIAARFPFEVDHADVPMHRITQFSPNLSIGGSASRRGQVGLALADAGADPALVDDWSRFFVYYAAIRSEGSGRVVALPGVRDPLVTYRLTDGDLSRLTRGLIHLGEALLAAGAVELYPSIDGGACVRRVDELARWWDQVGRTGTNLMTVHLTSSVGMGEDRTRTGADSYGRVWGAPNLRVNDASLVADAPGVNPQAAIMTIALRNAEHLLAEDVV